MIVRAKQRYLEVFQGTVHPKLKIVLPFIHQTCITDIHQWSRKYDILINVRNICVHIISEWCPKTTKEQQKLNELKNMHICFAYFVQCMIQ